MDRGQTSPGRVGSAVASGLPLLLAAAGYACAVWVAHDSAEAWTWVILLIPVLLSAVPIITRAAAAALIAGVAMLVFSGIAILSVGVFFIPATVAQLVVGMKRRHRASA